MARIMIPVEEFKERVARAAKLVQEKGLDVLVVNGSEADYADTRYFSNFWRRLWVKDGADIGVRTVCIG